MLFTLVDCIEHVAQKQNGSNVDRIRSRDRQGGGTR